MIQRTLFVDGNVFYCFSDGSVEWHTDSNNYKIYRTFGNPEQKGYLKVRRRNRYYKVHRLIAMAFVPNPNNLPEVDHINRNRSDNRPENLRWVDDIEQAKNRICTDRVVSKFGCRSVDPGFSRVYEKWRRKNTLFLDVITDRGTHSSITCKTKEEYDRLKPLGRRERFIEYHKEIKNDRNK